MIAALFLSTMILGTQNVRDDYPPPGNYPHNFEISQKYDKFRNARLSTWIWGLSGGMRRTSWSWMSTRISTVRAARPPMVCQD